MIVPRFVIAAFMVTAVLISAGGPARSGPTEGYWVLNEKTLGFVVPSFSINEFVALWFSCSGGGDVTAIVDLDDGAFEDGKLDSVVFDARGKRWSARGRGGYSEMHQYAMLEAAVPPDLFNGIAGARSLKVTKGDQSMELVTTKFRDLLPRFRANCGLD